MKLCCFTFFYKCKKKIELLLAADKHNRHRPSGPPVFMVMYEGNITPRLTTLFLQGKRMDMVYFQTCF